MLAWSEELITDVEQNHGYDVIVGGNCYSVLDHPRKLVTLNPKLKSTGAGRYLASFPLVGCLQQAAWPERLLSEKSGRCGIAAN